jgi:hypothetical protein
MGAFTGTLVVIGKCLLIVGISGGRVTGSINAIIVKNGFRVAGDKDNNRDLLMKMQKIFSGSTNTNLRPVILRSCGF